MATRPYEGNLKAYYLPTVANLAAPTVAEITAGTEMTPALVASGVSPNHTENTVSTPMLTGFIRQNIGTEGITFNLQMIYDPDTTAVSDVYALFDTRGKAGVLLLAPEGDVAATAVVQTYQATFGRRKLVQSAQDTDMQYTVMVAVNADYNDAAVVSAT